MRIFEPKNEFGQNLLSVGDMVSSVKTVEKTLTEGEGSVVIVPSKELGGGAWFVSSVTFNGNTFLPEVINETDKITVVLDDGTNSSGEKLSGTVIVTLTNEKTMTVSDSVVQQPAAPMLSIEEVLKNMSLEERIKLAGTLSVQTTNEYMAQWGQWGELQQPFQTAQCVTWEQLCTVGGVSPKLGLSWDNHTVENIDLSSFDDATGLIVGMMDEASVWDEENNYDGTKVWEYLYRWKCDLPALTSGTAYFTLDHAGDGEWVQRMTIPLFAAEYGTNSYCGQEAHGNLESFEGNMYSLETGEAMFMSAALQSFKGALPKLKNGKQMFQGCSNLRSFNPFGDGEVKEGELTNGYRMFNYCILDIDSVERISEWLPSGVTHSESDLDESVGWIHIGVADGVKDSGSRWTNAIEKMKSKGWAVVVVVDEDEEQV